MKGYFDGSIKSNLHLPIIFFEETGSQEDGEGRLIDFISGLVTEEKENFEKYEKAGVILDKN
jgi:hypothetical protein